MVSEGGGIIAQSAHHPQFQGGGGIGSLEQAAHGEIASIQQQRIRVELLLLVDGRLETGITAVGIPFSVVRGQEMGMHIMSK